MEAQISLRSSQNSSNIVHPESAERYACSKSYLFPPTPN